MKISLKFKVLSILCGLFLLSSVAPAQNNHSNIGDKIIFPEVEGWVMGEMTVYPQKGLGYSVPYQSEEDGTVTVYVYDGGLKKIADGIDDKNIKSQIKQAENDIKAFGERGYYDNVKLVKSETVTLGGNDGKVKSLYSLFNFTIQGNEVDSEIYLFGYQNNFIKIRATRLKGKNDADNGEVNKLLLEISKLFVK